jgi:DNA segregation ATPase FtsK/SpoIIIE-like protein
MSLVGKVRVTAKMQASSPNTPPKDRLLSDFVSREKMENVRDGCKRTLDEIQKKNRDLEEFLQGVADGTEKLKLEINEAYNVEDLVDCEHDAAEAHSRLKELLSRPGQRNDEEDDELDSLYDECMGRLRFLVDRRVSCLIAYSASLS